MQARSNARFSVCINNLRILDAAKEQAGFEREYGVGQPITTAEVEPFLREGFAALKCPAGGTYAIEPLGTDPVCSHHGSLPEATTRRSGRRRPDRW